MDLGVFIFCSLVTHLIFFVSVFDIYFTSPIIHGVREFQQDIKAPASRLVLFVADGLRADKFYSLDENKHSRAPYLRKVLSEQGMWGVSHTRVPTESRPGHVAMIAGFYEDVSAIMKGWKENPVEFDSVFNKSKNTWAFGSPDILPMFAKGASSSHVHIHCYEADIESFAGSDSSLLDTWVFDKFSHFLDEAAKNATLSSMLKEDKVVFFLHLLGIDTNGHSHKPWSKEYLNNIKKVDKGIEDVVNKIENYYSNDSRTAYVFASDHGMTDWGSHGAGLPSETLTPLVVWGAGARKHAEKTSGLSKAEKKTTKLWGLKPSDRHDVNQADIAPLMSALVGIPIPVNSVGVLPLPFLSVDKLSKAKLMLTNAHQISEQYKVKLSIIKANSFYFVPFEKLPLSKLYDMERQILKHIVNEKFDEAISLSSKLISLSLEGVQYYHTYHRTPLYIVVVMGFVGWVVLSASMVLSQIDVVVDQAAKMFSLKADDVKQTTIIFIAISIVMTISLFLLHVPTSYYLYFILPLPIWHYISLKRAILQSSYHLLLSNSVTYKKFCIYAMLGLIGVWALVASFFYRLVLTVELLIFAFLVVFTNVSLSTKLQWALICAISSIFPLLPVVGREANNYFIIIGGVLGSLCSFIVGGSFRVITLLPFTTGLLAAATSFMSSAYGYIPPSFHFFSWSILALSWLLPLCNSTKLLPRMLTVCTCHCAVYILISLSYDALFCVVFCVMLIVWTKLEIELSGNSHVNLERLDFREKPLLLQDACDSSFDVLRRSYVMLFFFVFAFFGVGNIASVNSFDVRIVLPFITVFKPFVMGGLLAYKVLLPYLLVVCALCCLAVTTRTSLQQLFCLGLMISDVMAMHFFFLVKDHGSWLDIGTSISHYVISMSMVTALLVFFVAAKFLTSKKLWK